MSKNKKNGKGQKDTGNRYKYKKSGRLQPEYYQEELLRLQNELVNLQYWIKEKDLRVVLIFEGRGGAGKGGVIQRITEPMNPRGCRVVALAKPSDTERSQWYFQRYAAHLPSAGEMVIFDRSWYNRSGVEKVMGFCTDKQYREFLRSCPEFERMLVRDGIILLKYWFSVSPEEQEKRFQERATDPTKRWKLSDMDLAERDKFVDYSRAKDETFFYTDIEEAPWHVVLSDDKRKARLNCIHHILTSISHEDLRPPEVALPPRAKPEPYERPPRDEQHFVAEQY
jgi:polyphosphate kinase 2